MDHFAGLDVSVKETSICIVDDTGRIVREVKVGSEPEALLKVLGSPAYRFKRIGLFLLRRLLPSLLRKQGQRTQEAGHKWAQASGPERRHLNRIPFHSAPHIRRPLFGHGFIKSGVPESSTGRSSVTVILPHRPAARYHKSFLKPIPPK